MALGLGAALLLAGCDALQRGVGAMSGASIQAKFGTPTHDRIGADESGTTVRMMIESRVPATWLDASTAMSLGLPYTCLDGESFWYVSQTPEGVEGEPRAWEIVHPAGTTFTQVIKCNPPPPYEFALVAGTPEQDAVAQVQSMLQMEGDSGEERFIVRTVQFHDRNRKYPAIASSLGYSLGSRMSKCPQGVSLNRLIVAAHPRPEVLNPGSLNISYVVLGLDAPCRESEAPAAPPPEPGSEG